MAVDDVEFYLMRSRVLTYIYTLIPVIGIFIAFGVSQREHLDQLTWNPTVEVIASICIFNPACVLGNLWAHGAEDLTTMKGRMHIVERLNMVWRTVVHVNFVRNDAHFPGTTIMRVVSIILLPLSTARECTQGPHLYCYLALHMLLVCYTFADDPWVEGWQWVAAVFVEYTLLYDILTQRTKSAQSRAMLEAMTSTIQKMLAMTYDGYLLLSKDGDVVGIDQKATSLFGEDMVGFKFEDAAIRKRSGGSDYNGLSYVHLSNAQGEVSEAEMYTTSCILSSEAIPLVLGENCRTKEGLLGREKERDLHLRALRMKGSVVPGADVGPTRDDLDIMDIPDTAQREQEDGARSSSEETLPWSAGEHSTFDLAERAEPVVGEVDEVVDGASISGLTYNSGAAEAMGLGVQKTILQSVGLGMPRYENVRVVARGTQGIIREVKDAAGQRRALKEITLKGLVWHRDFPTKLREADREVRILRELNWAKAVIVELVDAWIQADFTTSCIVMEWMPHTLAGVLQERFAKGMGRPPVDSLLRWLAQISVGLAAIHLTGIIHRDVKPSNILIAGDRERCKIADLGTSRLTHQAASVEEEAERAVEDKQSISVSSKTVCSVSSKYTAYTACRGTRAYMSPEILCKDGAYDQSTDIFSFGCMILEMVTMTDCKELRSSDQGFVLACEEALAACAQEGDEALTSLCHLCRRTLGEAGMRPTAREIMMDKVMFSHSEALFEAHPELQRVK